MDPRIEDGLSAIMCPFCSSDELRLVYEDPARNLSVHCCAMCEIVFNDRACALEQPDSTASIFNEERIKASSIEQTRWLTSDILQTVQAEIPRGSWLDVGCGLGEFLSFVRHDRYQLHGLEPNDVAANYVKAKFNFPVLNEYYRADLFPPASFDVITALQVFEHVANPRRFLEAAHSHLRPNGLLVIDVPSYDNPRFLLYRLTHLGVIVKRDFIPSHLFYYTRPTLLRLVREPGFEVWKVRCGRYTIKFRRGHPLLSRLLKPVDRLADRWGVGGIVLYARKSASSGVK